jgi:hypothetical protein
MKRKNPPPKPERILEVEIERHGRGIKLQLEAMFKAWDSGLDYRKIFTKFSRTAHMLGLSLDEFAYAIEKAGYIKICTSPSGKRVVFASSCPWTEVQLQDHMQQLDIDLRVQASASARRRYGNV